MTRSSPEFVTEGHELRLEFVAEGHELRLDFRLWWNVRDESQLYGAYVVLVASQMEAGTFVGALAAMGVDADELVAAARTELDIVNS